MKFVNIMILFYVYCFRKILKEKISNNIVGILTLPTSKNDQIWSKSSFSQIPASYVKWIEQSGLRVIPIKFDLPLKSIRILLRKINGLVIPGGAANFINQHKCKFIKKIIKVKKKYKKYCASRFMKTVNFILKEAIIMNENNIFFPIWGTCLGFEVILVSLSKQTLPRRKINSLNHSQNVFWEKINSKYFIRMNKSDLNNMQNKKILFYNHIYGILPEDIMKNKYLKDSINIIATTKMDDNTKFVSIFEHSKYPFIGVQFHPEKIQFEHKVFLNKIDDFKSINISYNMSILFAKLVLKNNNYFDNERVLQALLIYNYPIYKNGGSYEQIYTFPRNFELYNLKNNKIK